MSNLPTHNQQFSVPPLGVREELTAAQKQQLEEATGEIAGAVLSFVSSRAQKAWDDIATDVHGTPGDERCFRRMVVATALDYLERLL
jgi:hypothetical protein